MRAREALPCPAPSPRQAFYGRKLSARQLLLGGAVAPPPAAASLYSALDGLLEHAGTMAGPQFLTRSSRAASEPGLGLHPAGHALPAATAVLPQAAGGDSSEDDWEPEEPTAPALPRVRWGRHDGEPSTSRAAADVANGLPWGGGSSAVASPTYDEASPWGNLFD